METKEEIEKLSEKIREQVAQGNERRAKQKDWTDNFDKNKTYRKWCFTLNNPTDEENEAIDHLCDSKTIYLIYGYERGQLQNTPHLQGYMEFKNPQRFAGIKKLKGFERAHIAPKYPKSTREQARDYCKKEGDFYEFGNWEAGGQGSRTDKHGNSFDWHAFHEFIKDNPDFSDIREEYPEQCIKYTNGIQAILNDIKRKNNIDLMDQEFEGCELWGWQKRLIKDVQGEPDKRKIIWIVDSVGNRGKTWMAKYLLRYQGSAYLQNGKSADIAHAYNGERVVTFDYCRCNETTTNYQIIEQIKNGIVFSPKYNSITKINPIPHVIVFSNFEPDRRMLSADRWDIRYLDENSSQPEVQTDAGNTNAASELTKEEIEKILEEITKSIKDNNIPSNSTEDESSITTSEESSDNDVPPYCISLLDWIQMKKELIEEGIMKHPNDIWEQDEEGIPKDARIRDKIEKLIEKYYDSTSEDEYCEKNWCEEFNKKYWYNGDSQNVY